MRSGSVTSAITRNCPPQSRQRVMSISKTRFKRCAQVSGTVGVSLQSLCDSVDEQGLFADAAAESLRFLRLRAVAGVGTDRAAYGRGWGEDAVVAGLGVPVRLTRDGTVQREPIPIGGKRLGC